MKEVKNSFSPLKGSNRGLPQGNKIKSSNLNDIIDVTVRIRRKQPIDDYVKKVGSENKILKRSEYAAMFGANPEDIEKVKSFAHQFNLTVVSVSAARRSVFLKGTIQNFSAAFNVHLSDYISEKGKAYRGRTGFISVPAELQDIIAGVFGLDNREQARPMSRLAKDRFGRLLAPADADQVTYSPADVAKAYNYPQDVNGSGQCIALIELGGGYRSADLDVYFSSLNLSTPAIIPQSVDGGVNEPSDVNSDGEVVLDIEVAGAVAPGAKIVVYFAPNNDQGFLDAITAAVHDEENNPTVISISWASSEEYWSQQSYDNFEETLASAKTLGLTVLCAAGDHGSSNQETDGRAHVSYPASSHYVLACGGTNLAADNEVVWNDNDGWATGGGISEMVTQVPDYQGNINLPASVNPGAGPGRGVPDIAGNASQLSGYNTYIDGAWYVSSGTSAVAPLTGALIALANQKLGRNVGFIHNKLYSAPPAAFKDITSGNNITAAIGGYTASAGWDACTGLGVPLGDIIQYL